MRRAQARIFLTDGGHDVGTYNNGHLTHKVPTYVIGFSPGVAAPEDQQRLQTIASDTGGRFFPLTDSSQLQSVMNTIGAEITCQTPPQSFSDALKQGASKAHAVTVGASTKSLQIALTWASPLDKFTISQLKLVRHGRTIAKASRRVKKLTVKTVTSPTFTVLKVSGLTKGKLTFKVNATAVGSGQPQVTPDDAGGRHEIDRTGRATPSATAASLCHNTRPALGRPPARRAPGLSRRRGPQAIAAPTMAAWRAQRPRRARAAGFAATAAGRRISRFRSTTRASTRSTPIPASEPK